MILDNFFMEVVHAMAIAAPSFFTPLFKFITFLGEKAWFFLLIAFILCLRKRTRWIGVTIILSIFLAFIFGDVILKPLIGRVRPYKSDSVNFYKYWKEVGAIEDKGFSMPSGHTLGVSCFFISLYISCKKSSRKLIAILGAIGILLMVFSRMYFMHHYFTDCLVAFVLSAIISLVTKYIVRAIHSLFKDFENVKLCNFVLNFDILDIFRN